MQHNHTDIPVVARFVFKPDRAAEFTEDARQVIEMALDSTDEAMDYIEQFADALLDANVLINGANVVHLSDFLTPHDEELPGDEVE